MMQHPRVGFLFVLLPFLAALTSALLVYTFFLRADVADLRAKKAAASAALICRKVDKLDVALIGIVQGPHPPRPGDFLYAYWRSHPEEHAGFKNGPAIRQYVVDLRKAACDPKNLPLKGGNP